MEEAAEPRRGRGAALEMALKEDLEIFGVEELRERIEMLQAEIARTQAQLDRKKASRSAADAFFAPKS